MSTFHTSQSPLFPMTHCLHPACSSEGGLVSARGQEQLGLLDTTREFGSVSYEVCSCYSWPGTKESRVQSVRSLGCTSSSVWSGCVDLLLRDETGCQTPESSSFACSAWPRRYPNSWCFRSCHDETGPLTNRNTFPHTLEQWPEPGDVPLRRAPVAVL
ncbi:hypothetical protein VTK26DRAFT_8346 [Humicola hyalothermophila]